MTLLDDERIRDGHFCSWRTRSDNLCVRGTSEMIFVVIVQCIASGNRFDDRTTLISISSLYEVYVLE